MIHRTFALVLLITTLCSPARAEEIAALPKPGLDAMRRIELLPLLPPSGTQVRQFISYDPSSGNGDGMIPGTWARYVDERGDYVFFDEFGPGCLYRQQMNAWQCGLDPKQTFIRYYFDDDSEPRISMTLDQYWGRGGFTPPFAEPLHYFDDLPKNPHHPSAFDRMGVSYLPMPFKKRLRIALSPPKRADGKPVVADFNGGWFQYTYTLSPADAALTTWTGNEDVAAVVGLWNSSSATTHPVPPATTTMKMQIRPRHSDMLAIVDNRGGAITSVRLTLDRFDEDTFYNTYIRVRFDDTKTPAVDMPIGCFFGGGAGEQEIPPAAKKQVWDLDFATLMYGYSKTNRTFHCNWPMPFWKKASIEIDNRCKSGGSLGVTLEVAQRPASELDYPRDRTGYFHARRTVDAQQRNKGAFVRSFREQGYGKVVGISFFTEGWSCDGDEFTFIDGSLTPQIHGDGSEDDHNAAWGGDRYHKPLWGSFTRYGDYHGVQQDYRLYLGESYAFHRGIDITYECSLLGGMTQARAESVVFYYKLDGERCNLRQTDEVDVGNSESEKAHDYKIVGQTWQGSVTSAYDGYEKEPGFHSAIDDGRAFSGSSAFTVAIDPANDGVRVRRRIDRQHNSVQRSKVLVDGVEVTERPWYVCDLGKVPDNQRWRDCDFDIPAKYTRGKDKVRLTFESAPTGNAERGVNEFRYWIDCFGLTPLIAPQAH